MIDWGKNSIYRIFIYDQKNKLLLSVGTNGIFLQEEIECIQSKYPGYRRIVVVDGKTTQ